MDLTGTLLGERYRVGALLGRGGMGAVYDALQEDLGRAVALKIVHRELAGDASICARFRREARVVARVRHPNVVQISEYVDAPPSPPFLVMERLHGETLREALKRTPRLSAPRVVRIARQVLSALDAAHRASVVHRDIKPDNVFLEQTSAAQDLVKLLDFGVAKLVGEADDAMKLTRQGQAIGTPAFMSPEQAMGDPVDGRADLYAVGATIYLALTGRKPHEAKNLADLMHALFTEPPALVTAWRPDLDARLASIIARALEKQPARRFANALEMAEALAPFEHAAPATARSPVHDTIDERISSAPLPRPRPLERMSARPIPPQPQLLALQAVRPPRQRPRDDYEVIVAIAIASVLVCAGLGFFLAAVIYMRGRPAAEPETSAPTITADPTR